MLNLETAKKLKVAGLKWEPKKFDLYLVDFSDGSQGIYSASHDGQELESFAGAIFTWLLRLDQLLAEIESRGWEYTLESHTGEKTGQKIYVFRLITEDGLKLKALVPFSTINEPPDEAAAQALIWILEGGECRGSKEEERPESAG